MKTYEHEANINLPPILPVGTAVVGKNDIKGRGGAVKVPAGAVGRIVQSPVVPTTVTACGSSVAKRPCSAEAKSPC